MSRLSAIEDGVRAGLEKFFAPGGAFSRALGDAFEPFAKELRALRRFKFRHSWHPIAECPDRLKDGNPVLVSVKGDLLFAAWFPDNGGYWDADIEYGGEPVEPEFFILLPTRPASPPLSEMEKGS